MPEVVKDEVPQGQPENPPVDDFYRLISLALQQEKNQDELAEMRYLIDQFGGHEAVDGMLERLQTAIDDTPPK